MIRPNPFGSTGRDPVAVHPVQSRLGGTLDSLQGYALEIVLTTQIRPAEALVA